MTEPLHIAYRPRTFDEVVGQDAAVRGLRRVVEAKSSHAYLFTGPSGVGKTTLARIAATALGCIPSDLEEIDAATHTGVDDMRQVTAQLIYRPLGEGTKAIIVDEAHRLSKQAWESLLKIIEEPPPWVYWFFCTTDPARVPVSIKTRCTPCELGPVRPRDIEDLLFGVIDDAKIDVGADEEKIVGLCARQAEGSPRQALVYLSVCAGAKSLDEARELMRSAEELAEAVDLARVLVKRGSWREAQELLGRMADADPESVRRVVRAYVSKVVLGAKSDDQAGAGLEILDAFAEPCPQGEGLAHLLVACGRVLLAD